jgi:hypothetical protein
MYVPVSPRYVFASEGFCEQLSDVAPVAITKAIRSELGFWILVKQLITMNDY